MALPSTTPSLPPRRAGVDLDALALGVVPPAPRTPSPRARRVIFGYQGGQKVVLLLGAAFLALGSLLALVFCWGLPVDVALALQSEPAQGVVQGRELNTSVRINGRHPTRVRFTYAHDGLQYAGEVSTLREELIAAAQPGAVLPLEVHPSVPSWARVQGETVSEFGYAVAFVLLFPALGAALLVGSVRGNRREKAAFTHGIPVTARVTASGPDVSTTVNGRHPWQVAWAFEVEGRTYTGSLSSLQREDLEELLDTERLTVLYLREDPRANTAWLT